MIKNVCVFSSSSNSLAEIFYEQAELLGELLGKNGFNVVYGGSKLGLMYRVAKKAKENGAQITGVMPEKLYDLGVSETFCDKFYLTKGMRERKGRLDIESDAVVALPGGFGTIEELSEMIVQKQLCYNSKPIIIVNTGGFYDYLLKFFENIITNRFANKESEKLYYVANSPREAVEYLRNYTPRKTYPVENVLRK